MRLMIRPLILLPVFLLLSLESGQSHRLSEQHNFNITGSEARKSDSQQLTTIERSKRSATLVSESSSAAGRLCLENGPDGLAILRDTESDDEIVIFFKMKSLWPTSLKSMLASISDGTKTNMLSSANEYDISELKNFPASPHYVVSPTGLDKNHTFFNSLFVFKNFALYRFRITKLTYSMGSEGGHIFDMKSEYIDTYNIHYWFNIAPMEEILTIFMPRATRILGIHRAETTDYSSISGYFLVDASFERPLETLMTQMSWKYIRSLRDNNVKFFYELNEDEDILYQTSDGYICYNKNCKSIRSAIVECPRVMLEFTQDWLFWIWTKTDLSIRLVAIGLSSIMIIDFILALAFVYNQVKRVMDLT